MLKAQELRIGNLVQSYADIISVEYVDKLLLKGVFHRDVIYNTSLQVKHCKPIPLNEEWLLKLGFQKDRNGYFLGVLSFSETNSNELMICINDLPIQTICKYVHQLQNLYFSLTGVELELSSNVA